MNRILAGACLCLVVACGDDDPPASGPAGAVRYACDNRALESTCFDYDAQTKKEETTNTCDGTVLERTCPPENAVGTCTKELASSQRTTKNTYYSDGPTPWTETSAMGECGQAAGIFAKP